MSAHEPTEDFTDDDVELERENEMRSLAQPPAAHRAGETCNDPNCYDADIPHPAQPPRASLICSRHQYPEVGDRDYDPSCRICWGDKAQPPAAGESNKVSVIGAPPGAAGEVEAVLNHFWRNGEATGAYKLSEALQALDKIYDAKFEAAIGEQESELNPQTKSSFRPTRFLHELLGRNKLRKAARSRWYDRGSKS